MHILSTLLPSLGLFAQLSAAAYTLEDDYGNTSSFFSKFSFYTGTDPTNGYVDYLTQSAAQSAGIISASNGTVYMGVDSKNTANAPGRQSVRLASTKTYEHGLVILDLAHMPGSVCGTWPAFWMLGANWPNNGEIDIIEGVNEQSGNSMTLHTSDGCTINNSGFSGTLGTSNCYVSAPGQSNNAGCGISDSSAQSYGTGFNSNGGGVYATEWTSSGISIWFFPRSGIPGDISSGSPNPSGWGTPVASFAGGCNIDQHFNQLQIVFDITFCGDWAGAVWSTGSCASKASTCQAYVQSNPSAFTETYWSVNSLKVFQDSTSSQNQTMSRLISGRKHGRDWRPRV